MMNFIKKNIVGLLLGIFICSSTVFAAKIINSNEVIYIDKNMEEKKLSNALDDLYDIVKKYDKQEITIYHDSNTAGAGASGYEFKNSFFKKFKIVSLTPDSNVGNCYTAAWSVTRNENINLEINKEYLINDLNDTYCFNTFYVISGSKGNMWSRCVAKLEFYN